MLRNFYLICVTATAITFSGCAQLQQRQAMTSFEEANLLSNQERYQAALDKYSLIAKNHPVAADRALFEMGIVLAHPKNEQKDYERSLKSFQELVREHPSSGYRQDSEMMIFYLDTVLAKDRLLETQQTALRDLRQQLVSRDEEAGKLQRQVEALEQKLADCNLRNRSADRVLIEKRQRRLTLYSQGEVLKTYKIALGGNPDGAKERQGDNKTPEGIYRIDSRNKDSRYHLSLRISYPNEQDRKRAKKLGVPPGGDIMIHGIKNGMSYVGELHVAFDWTQGCIAVTDEEIDEIGKFVADGTVVEIRP